MVEEDEPDNMMLHYDEEDEDEDDSTSHDHVSHQSEQDDEQSEELSSTSEDNITDIIHEEIGKGVSAAKHDMFVSCIFLQT